MENMVILCWILTSNPQDICPTRRVFQVERLEQWGEFAEPSLPWSGQYLPDQGIFAPISRFLVHQI